MRRLSFSAMGLLLLVCVCGVVAGEDPPTPNPGPEEDPFEIRKLDEVRFNNGDIVKGTLFETDNKDEYTIKDYKSSTKRFFKRNDVKEILHKQTKEEAFEKASKSCVGDADKTLKIAKLAKARFNGLDDKIVTMMEREAGSKNPDLLSFLCDIYLQQGKGPQALKTAEVLTSSAGTRAKSWMLHGMAQLAMNNPAEAEKDLEKAAKLAPDDPDILVARANFLLSSGRSGDASAVFTNALAKNPKNVAALIGQGLVRMRQGDFFEAEKSFTDALLVSPDNRQARIGMAAVKIMMLKFDEAYQIGEGLLAKNPKDADAYAMKAFSKVFSGDKAGLAAFETQLKESLKERPNQPRLLLAWAAALERQAKVEEMSGAKDAASNAKTYRDQAAAKFAELEGGKPADSVIQYLLAERKFRSNDFAAAQAGFQRTAELAPTYAPAFAALGATALNLSNWQAASDAYEKAAQLDPMQGEYLAGKGLALLKMQRFEVAEDLFKKALDLDAKNVTARCGLGYVKNFAKNKAAAIDFFQQALAVDGNCAYAADALARIYKQDDLALEYINFEDEALASMWRSRNAGSVKSTISGGKLVFSGTQGSSMGSKVEYYKDIKADDFARIEADFEMAPTSPVTFGLRIASTAGTGTNFEAEMGKDETGELKIRFRDYQTTTPSWQGTKIPWPTDGHVRLGMDTDDFKGGKLRLWMNGKQIGEAKLILQKPNRLTAGVFVQLPPKETITASVDNLVLVTRTAPVGEKEGGEAITIFNNDQKKPDDKDKQPDKVLPK